MKKYILNGLLFVVLSFKPNQYHNWHYFIEHLRYFTIAVVGPLMQNTVSKVIVCLQKCDLTRYIKTHSDIKMCLDKC